MSAGFEPVAFAGIDWAEQKHDVCVVDRGGHVLGERCFAADAKGLAAMADWLVARGGGPPEQIAVAIEVPHGPVVELLLERGFAVLALNPKQLDRFRDRFTVAGAKDDRRDARVLADSLRTDRRAYRRLENDDADVIELREWSRMASDLTREDTALCNRARQQLLRYFPQVLELSNDVGEAWILALLEMVPTPADAHRRRRSSIEKLLRSHRIRRCNADQVLEVLRRPALTVAPGTVAAATAHLRLVSRRIGLVRRQLAECQSKLDEICSRLGDDGAGEGRKNEPRDVEILQSLPGIGRVIAATLFAEASRPLRNRDYQALRALAGIAPVTASSGKRSGRRAKISMRRACNLRLRNATYHWARVASHCDPIWRTRYVELRARGHSHGRACRGIADRLLAVAIAMLKSRTLYDPSKIGSTRRRAVA
jgi:transposase